MAEKRQVHIALTVMSAGPLLNVAEEARDKIAPDVADLEPGQRQTWIAVVFAMAAAEAFMNDLEEFVAVAGKQNDAPQFTLLAKMLEILEQRNGNAELKMDVTHQILTGQPADRGLRLHQEFATLTTLRNKIIHAKPDRSLGWTMDGEAVPADNDLLNRLQQWKLASTHPGLTVEMAATRAVAAWACRVARERVASLRPLLATGIDSKYLDPIFEGFVKPSSRPR